MPDYSHDPFGASPKKADDPAYAAASVTPDDDTNLTDSPTRGLYVGGAGNVEVIMQRGDTVVFSGVPAGTILPVRVTRVKSTNTTATTILALY
jgi:hypothetical protein